jgi:hypothetical protein
MPKSDLLPELVPDLGRTNLKGLTLWELERRQELNTRNMALLQRWLNELENPVTYGVWKDFDQLRKRLNRAIYLKRLKLWLLSLVGRN